MLERDDTRREKGSSLTPIQANRLFRAMAQGAHHQEAKHELDMGCRFEEVRVRAFPLTSTVVKFHSTSNCYDGNCYEPILQTHETDPFPLQKQFLKQHKLEEYVKHFGLLGCAFERDLLDITEKQLTLLVDRHGLKILDKRRYIKALAMLRRKLSDLEQDPSRSDSHARSGRYVLGLSQILTQRLLPCMECSYTAIPTTLPFPIPRLSLFRGLRTTQVPCLPEAGDCSDRLP
jgi:hypothetical protein